MKEKLTLQPWWAFVGPPYGDINTRKRHQKAFYAFERIVNVFSNRFKIFVFSLNLKHFGKCQMSTAESEVNIRVRPVSYQKQEVLNIKKKRNISMLIKQIETTKTDELVLNMFRLFFQPLNWKPVSYYS